MNRDDHTINTIKEMNDKKIINFVRTDVKGTNTDPLYHVEMDTDFVKDLARHKLVTPEAESSAVLGAPIYDLPGTSCNFYWVRERNCWVLEDEYRRNFFKPDLSAAVQQLVPFYEKWKQIKSSLQSPNKLNIDV